MSTLTLTLLLMSSIANGADRRPFAWSERTYAINASIAFAQNQCNQRCVQIIDPVTQVHLGFGCIVGSQGFGCVAQVDECIIRIDGCGGEEDPEGLAQAQVQTEDGWALAELTLCRIRTVVLQEERTGFLTARQEHALMYRHTGE